MTKYNDAFKANISPRLGRGDFVLKQLATAFRPIVKHKQLITMVTIFYLVMGISQYSQILFAQQTHNLLHYSIAYSAMAIAGALSFLLSPLVARLSPRQTALIFLPLYGIGMLFRTLPGSLLFSALSGLLSGLGASITLLLIRTWIYSEADQDSDAKGPLVAARYSVMQLSTLFATIIAGAIASLFKSSNIVYIVLLLSAALIMASLGLTVHMPANRMQQKENRLSLMVPKHRLFGVSLMLVTGLMGITTALIDPILPAIFRQAGLSVGLTTFWVTTFGIITVLASFIFQRSSQTKSPVRMFLVGQLCAGICMIITGLLPDKMFFAKILGFGIMSFFIASLFIFKELMEYDMFPKSETVILLGVAQSGFLVGDALGSPLGTFTFQHFGNSLLMILYGALSITIGVLYWLLYFRMKANVNLPERDDD
ncbi:MFS transporter [Furfurilactobacillus sp. WILCCON 0119]